MNSGHYLMSSLKKPSLQPQMLDFKRRHQKKWAKKLEWREYLTVYMKGQRSMIPTFKYSAKNRLHIFQVEVVLLLK